MAFWICQFFSSLSKLAYYHAFTCSIKVISTWRRLERKKFIEKHENLFSHGYPVLYLWNVFSCLRRLKRKSFLTYLKELGEGYGEVCQVKIVFKKLLLTALHPPTLYLWRIREKLRLLLCKLRCLIRKCVMRNFFLKNCIVRYIFPELFFHEVSWLTEIVFYFTIDIRGKPFLWLRSHESRVVMVGKTMKKLETVDKNLPFVNFVTTHFVTLCHHVYKMSF